MQNAIFVFIIVFSAFLAFEPLFENLGQKAAQEFASAIFGTIFAAVITMVLLSRQTQTEEERSKGEKVFEQKISLYNEAIEKIQNIFEKLDNNNQAQISRAEIVQIEFLLAKMIMIGSEKTIREFKQIYDSMTINYNTQTGLLSLNSTDKQTVFRFADYCREELGLSDKNIEKSILEDIVVQGDLFYHLKKDDKLPINTIETLKDIYGFIVFDLAIPLLNINFKSNGFEVHNNKEKNNPLIKCVVNNENLCLTIPKKPTIKTKHFKLNPDNSFTILPKDRQKFIDDSINFEKILGMAYDDQNTDI